MLLLQLLLLLLLLIQTLWLRAESKEGEERVCIVPVAAAELVSEGYRIVVERSDNRCYTDADYAAAGCQLVHSNTWQQDAPHSAIIIGLKELPEHDQSALVHRHLMFAHCYKQQGGWRDVLSRFTATPTTLPGVTAITTTTQNLTGILYDLEFLVDAHGRRVAAFGRAAGIVGMALALKQWAIQHSDKQLSFTLPLRSWPSMEAAIADVKQCIAVAVATLSKSDVAAAGPRCVVLGALGRCGGGAVWFAEQCGVSVIAQWDVAETSVGGPFPQLLTDYDVLVNAIYLSSYITPFIDNALLTAAGAARSLSVISDVSCDTSNPFNPLPIYNTLTTLRLPVLNITAATATAQPLDMIAIDHLPSMIPHEASNNFCRDLMPFLRELKSIDSNQVFERARALFNEKVLTL